MADTQKPTHPRPGYLVYRASRLFMRLNESRLAPRGVVVGQIPVIIALGKSGTLNQKELTLFGEVEQPTMANLLARMERDGLIQREPDPTDRRSSMVRLTPTGEAAFPAVVQSIEEVNDKAYAGFTPEERTTFATLLLRIIDNLEAVERADEEQGG